MSTKETRVGEKPNFEQLLNAGARLPAGLTGDVPYTTTEAPRSGFEEAARKFIEQQQTGAPAAPALQLVAKGEEA